MSGGKTNRSMKWSLLNPCLAAILTFLVMYDHPVDDAYSNSSRRNVSQSAPNSQSVPLVWRLRQAFDALTGQSLQTSQLDPECDEECRRDKQDLEAQMDMALWSQGMFWTNALIIIVTGLGVYYVARTLGATATAANAALESAKAGIASNEIQRETLRANHLVHLDIGPLATPSAPLKWRENALSIRFKVALENVGIGPAFNAVVQGHEVNEALGDDSLKVIDELKVTCKAISLNFGQIIKPGETKIFPINVKIEKERAKILMDGRGDFPGFGICFILCGVYYNTFYSTDGTFKRFCFTVMKSAPDAIGAPITSDDIPLNAEQLVIRCIRSDGPDIIGTGGQAES